MEAQKINQLSPQQRRYRRMSILWGVLVIPSIILFVSSFFVFDTTDPVNTFTQDNILRWMQFIIYFTIPFTLALSCIGGLVLSIKYRDESWYLKYAKLIAFIPLIHILIILVDILTPFIKIVASIIWSLVH